MRYVIFSLIIFFHSEVCIGQDNHENQEKPTPPIPAENKQEELQATSWPYPFIPSEEVSADAALGMGHFGERLGLGRSAE